MLDQALPLGINLASPVTWFVIAVAAIVLALTVSTRRGSAPARSDVSGGPIVPLAVGARLRYTDEWTAAQALFVDDPRAGCERAQAIVTSAARDRGVSLQSSAPLAASYISACAAVQNAHATTDDLREAFKGLRALFDVLLTGEPDSLGLRKT